MKISNIKYAQVSNIKYKNNFAPGISRQKMARWVRVLILSGILSSCQKFVQTPPPVTTLSSENTYTSVSTAAAVLDGIYISLNPSATIGSGNSFSLKTSLLCGLSADEFSLISTAGADLIHYHTNGLTNQNGDIWNLAYPIIFNANSAIAGISNSNSLPTKIKEQLLGEAQFVRAFLYFYLVNLYGPVPLALTTTPQTNATLSRAPISQVYQQIISDLTSAQSKLSTQFLDGTILNPSADRSRPSYWAATALLARVYLCNGYVTGDNSNFSKAASESSILINNRALFGLSSLDQVFLKASLGNNEAIWQLEPTAAGFPTTEAREFVLPATGPSVSHPVWLSDSLMSKFEPGDQRRTQWVNSVTTGGTTYYFAYKYKNNVLNSAINEYTNIFRLGEQYLIRAEAETKLNDIAKAQADLNAIRNRAGLPNTTATTQAALITSILHERQVEFFSEMGHRWMDLKRLGVVNSIMGTVTPTKGGIWNANDGLYPVPATDLNADPNLVQNPGY
ncbi:RagB/SusD family nutrient uptake outer membrane protein [Mucilaginibacter sp. UR6-11]|uniref:RagB/SusD family nutrient uptake outer membrane protein n=1 Tax=Mucilaginibacter sp. UR6-11 TaxID=1435644 RepID=UPI001E2FCB9B|nr:RagB/SusD family nutrient uptake outer membrane protein [Mucilaginibacter sp. UR6-11]MCC8424295.1 RagB/SusD family nutrient uptake outer membrane protein [Mucilaginibacter sp. UR6-11]